MALPHLNIGVNRTQTRALLGVYRPNGSALQYAENAVTDAVCATCAGSSAPQVLDSLLQKMKGMPEVQASDRALFKLGTAWPWSSPYVAKGSPKRSPRDRPRFTDALDNSLPDYEATDEPSTYSKDIHEVCCSLQILVQLCS